jgi:hypothetical protein
MEKLQDKFSLAKAILKLPEILQFIHSVPKLKDEAERQVLSDSGLNCEVDIFYIKCGFNVDLRKYLSPSHDGQSFYLLEKGMNLEEHLRSEEPVLKTPFTFFKKAGLIK